LRTAAETLAIWRTVPRALLVGIDSLRFKKLTAIIEHGTELEIQQFLEAEERLRCLRLLRRSLAKANASLRKGSQPEALQSLKREFEQVEILLE